MPAASQLKCVCAAGSLLSASCASVNAATHKLSQCWARFPVHCKSAKALRLSCRGSLPLCAMTETRSRSLLRGEAGR